MNNIFEYAPKELVLDSFICWLFNFFNTDNKNDKKTAIELISKFYCFKNCDFKLLDIKSVDIKKQHEKSKIDVFIEITLQNNKKIYYIFENKVDTSHHSDQMNRHLESGKGLDGEKRYFYLKIGYIFPIDKLIPKEFTIIDLKDFIDLIQSSDFKYDTFEMYLEFLKKRRDEIENILKLTFKEKLNEEDIKKIFNSDVAMYEIINKIKEGMVNKNVEIGMGSSSGRPWVSLNLFSKDVYFDENKEWSGIFWRMDWRVNADDKKIDKDKGSPYLCLRQYKTWENESEMDSKYFEKNREIFKEVIKEFPKYENGKIHNRGNKEREIGIIFFNEKISIKTFVKDISKVTDRFIELVKMNKSFYEE